jgi:hypothetical protein
MFAKRNKLKIIVLITLLFLLAFFLRIYGFNWDQSQHLHPDERFLTMVAADIKLPNSLSQYFSTSTSPLNPYNYSQYQFFVYGTFPLFLVKVISSIFHQDTYDQVFLWGRGLSAFFDSLNIIFLFLISRKIFKKKSRLVILPSLFYTFCVLPLQLSHFFAVDTFLNTFLVATFTALVYGLFPLAAVFFGLALTSKVTALYFAPVIFLFLLKKKNFGSILFSGFCFLVSSLLVFRLFQPYSFTDFFHFNPQFVNSLKSLNAYNNRQAWYPPGVQWLSKTLFLFSLKNLFFWGIGLSLSCLFLISFFKTNLKKIPSTILIALFWTIGLYLYQGSQLVQTLRYFIIIIPFLCLLIGYFAQNISYRLTLFFTIGHLLFGVMFLSIYSRPHSRVQATYWINQNIPANSILSGEYWDDVLPLYLPEKNNYQNISLQLYDPDTPEKWVGINQQLNSLDYLVMSSNRLWGSIPLVPDRYPVASQFYQDLFAEKLNFQKIMEINSYPGFALPFLKKCYYFGPTNFPGVNNTWFSIDDQCQYPGLYLRDDTAEEAFTVYDHPKVLIFRKNQ